MDSDHVDEPLLGEEDPPWVTLAKEGEGRGGNNDSLWDRVTTSRRRNNNDANGRRRVDDDDDLPKMVLLMRCGNIVSAGLLIFVSVGNLWKIFSISKY